MLISTAWAHGSSGVESTGGYGPFIILAALAALVLAFKIEKKWRQRRQTQNGEQASAEVPRQPR